METAGTGTDSFTADDLSLTSQVGEGTVVVEWTGKANQRRPSDVLSPYLTDLAHRAHRGGLGIEFHFEQLEHVNSSTILVLMKFIQALRGQTTKLVMTYDGRLKWQKMTFEALRQLDRGDGLVEVRASQG